MIQSINGRMLIAASIVLAAFLGITGVTLENAFRASGEEALRERLIGHVNALIAAAEQDRVSGRINIVYPVAEPRLFTPGSGLYAMILTNRGDMAWISPSLEGVTLPVTSGLARGESRFEYMFSSDGEPLLVFSIGLTWGEHERTLEGYTFLAAESLYRLNDQVVQFRRHLWTWLGALTVVLLVMLTLILRWGLAPLRRVAEDLRDIESGRHLDLHGNYPRELRGLTENLNALIHVNREHEERYRASLGDLAHSLKTPLAVLRTAVEAQHPSLEALRTSVEEQVERMDQIVQYQLQRAASSGRRALTAPVPLIRIVDKVVGALNKVYADKGVECDCHIEPSMEFHGDEGDVMELLGNVVDNAYKWCRRRVRIRLLVGDSPRGHRRGLRIEVADDGPGIPEQDISRVLERGGRADPATQGHGLGLAMVQDIIELYDGALSIERADLGGAQIIVWLPMPG